MYKVSEKLGKDTQRCTNSNWKERPDDDSDRLPPYGKGQNTTDVKSK